MAESRLTEEDYLHPSKNKPTIRVRTEGEFIKIYINDLLHLAIIRKDIFSFQSWQSTKFLNLFRKRYYIEFISKTGVEQYCEYDNKETWVTILSLLNDFI